MNQLCMRVIGLVLLLTCVIAVCADAANYCSDNAEVTQGPYYYNSKAPVRANITEDRIGLPLALTIHVVNTDACSPFSFVGVEIWHCDADGVYSHYIEASNGVRNAATDNSTFLRGVQIANSNGTVTFHTVYPGWYTGRDIHIHMKIRANGTVSSSGYMQGDTVLLTSQLFFNDSLTELVSTVYPYTDNDNQLTENDDDGIFHEAGSLGMISYQFVNGKDVSGGLVGTAYVGVSPSARSAASSLDWLVSYILS